MKVIIIAAGQGSRLRNYTEKKPKGLLDINGKSIIERQIDLIRKNGINDIVIITGPNTNFNLPKISYIHDENYDEHDVLGSLMAARNEMKGQVLTSYLDIIFEESILKQLLNFKGDIGIPVDLDWEKSYEGRTEHPKSEADNVLIENNKILQIKKNIIKKSDEYVIGEFLGPMILSSKGSEIFVNHCNELERNHQGKFHSAPSFQKAYLTDMLQELIEKKIEIIPIIISGKWFEIDTLQDLENARKVF